MVLYATRQIPMPLSLDRLLDYRVAMEMTSSPDPLNLTSTMAIMYSVLLELLQLISPTEGTSLLYPALVEGGLSSFKFFYYRSSLYYLSELIADDIPIGDFNTMASNSWILVFQYTRNNETTSTNIPVYFLPTCDIDNTRTSQ
jgi:hypothetical protein